MFRYKYNIYIYNKIIPKIQIWVITIQNFQTTKMRYFMQ
jgi:hypothetical protein